MDNRKSKALDEASRERRNLARDGIVIVLTGVVLGVAFNQLQMSSRPPRGLPWIAATQSLDKVDSLVLSAGIPSRAPAPLSPVGAVAAPSPSSAAPTAAAPARPAVTTDPGGAAPRTPATSVLRAGLPVIPDTGRPLEVGLSTVTQLVEADAALVVDARERVEFAGGHIPGAVNVPYDEAVRDPARLGKLDAGGRPIIVYCSGGTCEASLLLAQMMVREFGMRRVLVYEGGFPEWVAAGKPVTKESG